jgi:hypothetical protein
MASFHELQLLAAQAWLAAGDPRRARAFARDLVDNTGADDVLPKSEPPTPRSPEGLSGAELVVPRPPLTPSGTESPVAVSVAPPGLPRTSTRPGFPAAPSPSRSSATMRSLPPGTSLPPYRIEPKGERAWSTPPPRDAEVERLETLSLPPGMGGGPPPPEERPRTDPSARLACTYLARELGREIRARYGVEAHSDVDGLETAQRFLREELIDGRIRTADELRQVMRQGGFLSELLARRLGARWVDLDSTEPGRWAMLVPSRSRSDEVARVWPFARVLRFVAMGHKERDLVSYYLELEGRSR